MGDPEDPVFRKGVWFGEDFSQETGLQVGEIEFILCEEGKNHNNFERKSGQHWFLTPSEELLFLIQKIKLCVGCNKAVSFIMKTFSVMSVTFGLSVWPIHHMSTSISISTLIFPPSPFCFKSYLACIIKNNYFPVVLQYPRWKKYKCTYFKR